VKNGEEQSRKNSANIDEDLLESVEKINAGL
jgi:hypothetical protein